MASIASGVSASPFIQPPLNSSSWVARRKSRSALAAAAASPRTNVIAVGPCEQLLQALGARLVGRPLGEGVLDDAEARVGVAQLGAQLGGLRHGDAAVVDREHRVGFLDLPGHLIDDRGLLVSVQKLPPIPGLRAKPAGVFGGG